MKVLYKKFTKIIGHNGYGGVRDRPVDDFINLVQAIAALPGIDIVNSHISRGAVFIYFYFDVKEQGLFFLTRCVGQGFFNITLSAGDKLLGTNGELPLFFLLSNEKINDKGKLKKEIKYLYDNLNYHIQNESFIKYYNIDLDKFDIVDKISIDRNRKINVLLDGK